MSAGDIQAQVDSVFKIQENNQFGDQRYALLFKPGSYDVNVQVGYYTTVIGLGNTPDAVTITGGVNALG
jgi:butyrate kinase